MEDRCEFIWQIIEDSPELSNRLHKLEGQKSKMQVDGYIELFRDIEEVMEAVVETYHSQSVTRYSGLVTRE